MRRSTSPGFCRASATATSRGGRRPPLTAFATAGQIDIVVMSFGALLGRRRPGGLSERAVLKLLGDDVLGVAAAGNQGTCRPFFPAALPEVDQNRRGRRRRAYLVLQLRRLGRCLRPGVDVISTFFDFAEGRRPVSDEDAFTSRVYTHWAGWSGTSFSAPKVAGSARTGDVPQSQRRRQRPDHGQGGVATADDPQPLADA